MKYNPLKNEKGVALMITLFAFMVMVFLATEIAYNTSVELAIGASQVDRLRAYYLAKSGVAFSQMRIYVYKNVYQKFGAQLGANKGMLDMIWQFPFAWPPILPDEASEFDKSTVKDAVKNSFIEGQFSTGIEAEDGRIDINELASPNAEVQKAINAQLVLILENRLQEDDEWAQQHRDSIKPQEIINNIADWIDADQESRNGGSENSLYANTDPPILPANRPLKTIDELHMVAGVTDEIYNLLAPRVTVYGIKGINVNLASAEVLRSLDKQITKDIADGIITRRNDPNQGPFQNKDEFNNFLQTKGVNVAGFNKDPQNANSDLVPLLFDEVHNFKIKSTGFYRKAQRDIYAIVYDFDKVKEQLGQWLTPPQQGQGQNQGQQSQGQQQGTDPNKKDDQTGKKDDQKSQVSSGPPKIIFWQESE